MKSFLSEYVVFVKIGSEYKRKEFDTCKELIDYFSDARERAIKKIMQTQ